MGGEWKHSAEYRFWSRVAKSENCWIWLGPKINKGYGHFKINSKRVLAHAYSLTVFLGRPLKDGFFALHICRNRDCVNPAHLYEGTKSDNAKDRIKDGTDYATNMSDTVRNKGIPLRRGDNHCHAKLTEEIVRSARVRYGNGESGYQLSLEFGVSYATMKHALSGRTWKHVT